MQILGTWDHPTIQCGKKNWEDGTNSSEMEEKDPLVPKDIYSTPCKKTQPSFGTRVDSYSQRGCKRDTLGRTNSLMSNQNTPWNHSTLWKHFLSMKALSVELYTELNGK